MVAKRYIAIAAAAAGPGARWIHAGGGRRRPTRGGHFTAVAKDGFPDLKEHKNQ